MFGLPLFHLALLLNDTLYVNEEVRPTPQSTRGILGREQVQWHTYTLNLHSSLVYFTDLLWLKKNKTLFPRRFIPEISSTECSLQAVLYTWTLPSTWPRLNCGQLKYKCDGIQCWFYLFIKENATGTRHCFIFYVFPWSMGCKISTMNNPDLISFSFRTWSSMEWCASISRTAWRETLPPSASVCRARLPRRMSLRRWRRSFGLTWGCSPRPDTLFMRSTSAGVSHPDYACPCAFAFVYIDRFMSLFKMQFELFLKRNMLLTLWHYISIVTCIKYLDLHLKVL